MKVLFLLVNSACNIACTYCFYTIGYEKRSRNRIRPEIADHVAKRIVSVGFSTVILTGGDPLHSLFKRETYMLVGKLKSQGCKVIVNTSAALLTDDDLDIIIALGVDRIDVSIDSHDPGVNDVQRGCHADTVRAIAGLIERGCRSVVTTTVVTSVNAPTLPETVLWLRSLSVEDVRIQRVFLPGDKCNENDIVQSGMHACLPQLPAAHVPNYIELTERVFRNETPPSDPDSRSTPACRMGKEYFVCDASGVLTPCFHRSDLVLGNLFSDPVETLVRSLGQHELVRHMLPPCFGTHCVSLFDNPKFWKVRP